MTKRIALICFIEITSILAYAKTQLNQAVEPYSFNVVMKDPFIAQNGYRGHWTTYSRVRSIGLLYYR